MNIVDEYINDSCLAVSKLMKALSSFEQEMMNSLVRMTKTNDPTEQTSQMNNIFSQLIPRDAIAGAMLQIAFMSMRHFPKLGSKNKTVELLEERVNETMRSKKPYCYPISYCVGREIIGIPVGLLIFAARNQYNHQDESVDELQYYNRIIFEALDRSLGKVGPTGMGFDLYSEKPTMYAYSVVMLIEWTYTVQTPDPISVFRDDLKSIMKITG
jgi:hypothetical protein